MKRMTNNAARTLCAFAAAVLALLAGGCDKPEGPQDGGESSFALEGVGQVQIFEPGQTRTFVIESRNIVRITVQQPAGWAVDCGDELLTVKAPLTLAGAERSGRVEIKYTGADGVSGQAVLSVRVEAEEDDPQNPDNPTDGPFSIVVSASGSTITYAVMPDDSTQPYWITLDSKNAFDMFESVDDFMAYDIDHWKKEYGDEYNLYVQRGPFSSEFRGLPAGTYVVCVYYLDDTLTTGYGFTVRTVSVTGGSTGDGPAAADPELGLGYEIGDGAPFGYPGQAMVVCYVYPNESVTGWYYGLYRSEVCASMSDDEIRANLKGNEAFHNQKVLLYPFDWNEAVVLCGFWLDAEDNEGPVERLPFKVALTQSSDWAYEDYIGEWTVRGTSIKGENVEFDISIQENQVNDSYKIFGFTRTGIDRTSNAPVRAGFSNGVIDFYESSTLGMDSAGNWLGFLGFAYDKAKPENKGYFNINHQTIATGVGVGDNIVLDWKSFSYEGYNLQYYTFVYGYLTEDDYREEYFWQYDEDLQNYIVSNMTISRKGVQPSSLAARHPFVKRSAQRGR